LFDTLPPSSIRPRATPYSSCTFWSRQHSTYAHAALLANGHFGGQHDDNDDDDDNPPPPRSSRPFPFPRSWSAHTFRSTRSTARASPRRRGACPRSRPMSGTPGLVPSCTIGFKALPPSADCRHGDFDILSSCRFSELFPAKLGIVASATAGWMRSLATRLLELPG
jgi:hypothetical protein